jgi:hypothetical protein
MLSMCFSFSLSSHLKDLQLNPNPTFREPYIIIEIEDRKSGF